MNAEALCEHLQETVRQRDELKAQLAAANARIATQSCFWDAAIEKYDTVLSVLADEAVPDEQMEGNEAAQAVRALMLRGVIRQWRPIESAPASALREDGFPVPVTALIYGPRIGVRTAEIIVWGGDRHANVSGLHGNAIADWGATHWMPPPTSPQ